MQKNKIIIGFSAASILLTVLVCYLIYSYMSPSRQTIYVFNDSYSSGTQVTADMLTPIQVDSTITVSGRKADVSEQFVTSSEYAEIIKSGDSLRMDVGEGMPLTMSMLSVIGGSSIEMNMKPSSIAVTVAVDNVTGISQDLKEGSRVNVYSTTDTGVSLILQNMRVLTVNKPDGELSSVTIETDLQQSMQLIYYSIYGKIYLGLVDASGYQAAEDGILSFSGYGYDDDLVTDDSQLFTNDGTYGDEDADLYTNGSDLSGDLFSSDDFGQDVSDNAEDESAETEAAEELE